MALQSIQANADHTNSVAPMRWSSLNKEMSQDGAPGVEYKRFVARWNDPQDKVMQQIKAAKLIKKFNKDGVVINTSKERSIDDTPEIQGDGQSTDVLDKTAMAAAKRMK